MLKEHRKCIFCGKILPKSDMLRIARLKNENVIIDYDKKGAGRGCYICFSCIYSCNFKNKGVIAKSLKTNIDIKIYNEIERYIKSLSIKGQGGEH